MAQQAVASLPRLAALRKTDTPVCPDDAVVPCNPRLLGPKTVPWTADRQECLSYASGDGIERLRRAFQWPSHSLTILFNRRYS